MLKLAIIFVAATIWLGCTRPDEEHCKKACLRYVELYQQEKWDAKLAEAPESEHAEIKRQQAAEWQDINTNPERGLQACVVACNRLGRGVRADCMIAAKTFAEAKECDE